MISPILGHDIKRSRSEALANEVEAFLANGGKIDREIVVKQSNHKTPMVNNNEYLAASKQRKEMQMPIIQDYEKWGGTAKWTILSNAIDGIVSAGQLSNVSRGVTSIKDLATWKKVVKAIENLKKEVK